LAKENSAAILLTPLVSRDVQTAITAMVGHVGWQYVEDYIENQTNYFTNKILHGTIDTIEEVRVYRAKIETLKKLRDTIYKNKLSN